MSPNKNNLTSPTIRSRSKQLRRAQTPAEKILWSALRNRQLGGYKFRLQHPIERYIVDFYCAQVKLIIELEGGTHLNQKEYDTDRSHWLNDHDYQVLRFQNHQIQTNLDSARTNILHQCERLAK